MLTPPEGRLDDAGLEKIVGWLGQNIGGEVVSITRQARWRPTYFAEIDRDGERLDVCVRGDRTDVPLVFPLEHEMLIQRLMHEHGVLVPKVYGWCDEPRCYVMERVWGAPHFDGATDAQRLAVMRDYMKLLAELHKLPVQPFKDAGVFHASHPDQAHEAGERHFEQVYRDTKKRPDPFLEFMLGWLHRNPLKRPGREAVITWDSGQFHHENGRLTSMIDMELGHVGDPMMDLAGFRMRDTVLGFGDFNDLYRIYEEYSGEPVDQQAIKYHHLFFTLANALSFHTALAQPVTDSDYMTNLQWVNETNRFALEALAEYLNVDLPEIEIPTPETTPVTVQFEHLVRNLRNVETSDPFLQHTLRGLFRLARHLQRWDEVGPKLAEANLDDMAPLLGFRPSNWNDGDAALEKFVIEDRGEHDLELIQLFNRRLQRAQTLNGPLGSAMARHNPIQRFER